MTLEEQVVGLKAQLDRIEAIVTQNLPGALMTGREAARFLGMPMSTFRRRFVVSERLRYADGKRFARGDVEELKRGLMGREGKKLKR